MTSVEKIAVVGAGTMGRGIAEASLASGVHVQLVDTRQDILDDAQHRIRLSLDRASHLEVEVGAEDLELCVGYASLADCDLVIEAVPELLQLKSKVLAEIERAAGSDAVLMTNTSSISITRLGSRLKDPTRLVGLHFFNPVPRMQLVEIVSGERTSARTLEAARSLAARLGKRPLVLSDRPGFVVNALLIPFLLNAARMADAGYARAEDIDDSMRLGCGHPMGPLALSDLVGLDVVADIADAMYAETRDPGVVVPGNLRRLVDAGRLGQKSGQGFYDYTRREKR
jgi:3-hydroxybutyryl-CoA dehydrogenase